MNNRNYILIIGIVFSIIFYIISSYKIEGQGLYYDELHQATGSFSYIGEKPIMFSNLVINGIPLMNMNYSGAIKTGIYGIYLRMFDAKFSIRTWRSLGIFFVLIGILVFSFLVKNENEPFSHCLLLVLLITDITVVLTSRHDWGPTALALLLRLILIAIWINKKNSTNKKFIILGIIIGFSIFEKLSSVVLITIILFIMIYETPKKIYKSLLLIVVGIVIGCSPLFFANIYTYFNSGYLISIHGIPNKSDLTFYNYVLILYQYLSLGNGIKVKSFILGENTNNIYVLEPILIVLLLLICCYYTFYKYREDNNDVLSIVKISILVYISIIVGLLILPSQTSTHHWIIGTPFQYIAISYTYLYVNVIKLKENLNVIKIIFITGVISLLCLRIFLICDIVEAFNKEKSSNIWDPGINRLAQFTEENSNKAIFIAADWGVGTQILCFNNGKNDIVYELFWNYQGKESINKLLENNNREIIYSIENRHPTEVNPENTKRILHDLEIMPNLQREDIEENINNLKTLKVKKYSLNE